MTNPLFQNFDYANEQNLWDGIVNEAISNYGQDMYYMPRKRIDFDKIYYEDGQSIFDSAYLIDVYIKNVQGLIGPGAFMSQIGMFEVRERFLLSVGITHFNNEVTAKRPGYNRPLEGDWIYVPLNQRIFEILKVDNKPTFYQHGALQVFDITCELIEYTNEKLETGIDEIDAFQRRNSTNLYDYALKDQANNVLTTPDGDVLVTDEYETNVNAYDPTRDNKTVRDEVADESLINFTEKNPFANNSVY